MVFVKITDFINVMLNLEFWDICQCLGKTVKVQLFILTNLIVISMKDPAKTDRNAENIGERATSLLESGEHFDIAIEVEDDIFRSGKIIYGPKGVPWIYSFHLNGL